tara:strand:+ start:174 stop:548 length:375 start_codon:yes stop_codon:yes gene_type:complete
MAKRITNRQILDYVQDGFTEFRHEFKRVHERIDTLEERLIVASNERTSMKGDLVSMKKSLGRASVERASMRENLEQAAKSRKSMDDHIGIVIGHLCRIEDKCDEQHGSNRTRITKIEKHLHLTP